jgi:hypothetical protein
MSTLEDRRKVCFQSSRNPLYDNSSDDDSEEEEERRLSEQHGEAAVDGGGTAKRTSEEDQIAAEYEGKTAKKKKPRFVFTVDRLTSADGLIRVATEFKRIPRPKTKSIPSTAAYSQKLIGAYHEFALDLWPGQHAADVLLKIEQLGPKAKNYLNLQRNELVRNRYLEGVLGREAAEKLLQQFEDYQKQDAMNDEFPALPEQADQQEATAVGAVATRATTRISTSPAGETSDSPVDKEQEATFEEEEETPQSGNEGPTTTASDPQDDDAALLKEMEAQVAAELSAKKKRKRLVFDDDSDDEMEATFDDDATAKQSEKQKDIMTEDEMRSDEEEESASDAEKDNGTTVKECATTEAQAQDADDDAMEATYTDSKTAKEESAILQVTGDNREGFDDTETEDSVVNGGEKEMKDSATLKEKRDQTEWEAALKATDRTTTGTSDNEEEAELEINDDDSSLFKTQKERAAAGLNNDIETQAAPTSFNKDDSDQENMYETTQESPTSRSEPPLGQATPSQRSTQTSVYSSSSSDVATIMPTMTASPTSSPENNTNSPGVDAAENSPS